MTNNNNQSVCKAENTTSLNKVAKSTLMVGIAVAAVTTAVASDASASEIRNNDVYSRSFDPGNGGGGKQCNCACPKASNVVVGVDNFANDAAFASGVLISVEQPVV